MSDDIIIASAVRTPIGTFNGVFSATDSVALGTAAVREALNRASIKPDEVDEVIMGQILTAGEGQNTARQTAMAAGIPYDKTAYQLNQVCGSGLRTIASASQAIQAGDAKIIVAGGQENMTLSKHTAYVRTGQKMGDMQLVDTMMKDGLWCAFNGYHMGNTAENVAQQFNISREEQDAFACASQNKAESAQKSGRFTDEIVPVKTMRRKKEIMIELDEYPRHGTTIKILSELSPVFDKAGSVTAGNASGINDGAAAVIVMREDDAVKRNLTPLARIASWATAGVDPSIMGTGPIPASQAALQKAGWSVQDLDLVESNEAFAAQSLAVMKALDLNPEIVNVNGGAIALGHPVGASGTRIMVTLLHEMAKRDVKKGLATLCIGGGMGIAMCVERF